MNIRALLPLLLAAALGGSAPTQADAKPQAAATPPAAASRKCTVDRSQPTDADKLLARKSYKEAEASYREALAKEPSSDDDRLGIVRALIGEDKMAESQAEAAAFLQAQPKNAVAEVAVAEAGYRAANIDAALSHARTAVADDPCEGRAYMIAAQLYEIHAMYGSSVKLITQAHTLRPTDELILRAWIDSLPRKRRQEELSKYLAGTHELSADDAHGFDNELQHLQASKPGECRITSKAEATQLPLVPVYADSTHPVAFGLNLAFNGERRRMQIDTGASGIVLTKSAAQGLGLQPEYKIKTGGVGDEGEVDSYLAHVQSVRIGDVEVSNCMVEVVSKSKIHVDGLIGMNVFSRWLITLDYQNASMRLAALPRRPEATPKLESDPLPDDIGDEADVPRDRYISPELKDWEPIIRIGHFILLPANLKPGSPLHFLIMDTGASKSVFSTEFGKETGKLYGSDAMFVGLSGKVNKVYETKETPLIVANLSLPPTMYYAYEITSISHHAGFEISGLLGLPTLQRLTIQIDYRDNLLKLTYDPKHDIQRF